MSWFSVAGPRSSGQRGAAVALLGGPLGTFCRTDAHTAQVLGGSVVGGERCEEDRFRPEVGTHRGWAHQVPHFPPWAGGHGRSEGRGRMPGFPGPTGMQTAGHWDPRRGPTLLLPPPSRPGKGAQQEELAFTFWRRHSSFPKSLTPAALP